MKILGISAYYHDSAACLIDNGRILSAAQEERFTRKKHDQSFPKNAIKFCLDDAEINIDKIDFICFYEKPFQKFDRILETYFSYGFSSFSNFRKYFPFVIRERIFQKKQLIREIGENFPGTNAIHDKLLFSDHHTSHAASAFFASPYTKAAVLVVDGVGEWATTSIYYGSGHDLQPIEEIRFPHSIGLFYSSITQYLGFKVNSGEYKVMGLAPYGKPVYEELFESELVNLYGDGSYSLNLKYFSYCQQETMINSKFENLLGHPMRQPEAKLTEFHFNVAASAQSLLNKVMLGLARRAKNVAGSDNLCIAGGVALNCVSNSKISASNLFNNVWVQPAAGDAGGAIGAALAAFKEIAPELLVTVKQNDLMKGALIGPEFTKDKIKAVLVKNKIKYDFVEEDELCEKIASSIAEGAAVGHFNGRMEFGPRALGNRSILADPRRPDMQKKLNLKIKFRESFRPFAPCVLKESAKQWFDLHDNCDNSHMLFVADVKREKRLKTTDDSDERFGLGSLEVVRSIIPAVTHVDYSARLQTVDKKTNLRLHKILQCFEDKTGCPILVNTSFNVRGEPIVCTPEDAISCFFNTNLDVLILGNYLIDRKDQDTSIQISRAQGRHFEPD